MITREEAVQLAKGTHSYRNFSHAFVLELIKAIIELHDQTPEQLRARADQVEAQNCTGLSAAWCPVHGDCSCPDRNESIDDDQCPLHGTESSHAC